MRGRDKKGGLKNLQENEKRFHFLPPRADPLICVSSGISVQLVCGHIIGLSIDFPGGRQVAAGGLYWMLTD